VTLPPASVRRTSSSSGAIRRSRYTRPISSRSRAQISGRRLPRLAGAAWLHVCLRDDDLPNVNIVGYDVVSNRPKVAAYRAPGAPISSFGVESCLDELARELGIDPLLLREKNAATEGTRAVHGPTWTNIGYRGTLAAARAHPNYRSRSVRTKDAGSPAASGSTSAASRAPRSMSTRTARSEPPPAAPISAARGRRWR
jgi:CO/xanthine dehydrogenase Mo-binding subunit